MSEEDKWWSPDHVADEGDSAPSKNTAEDSSKEEVVGRENIDKFLDDIGSVSYTHLTLPTKA